jgi:hypothetical protein
VPGKVVFVLQRTLDVGLVVKLLNQLQQHCSLHLNLALPVDQVRHQVLYTFNEVLFPEGPAEKVRSHRDPAVQLQRNGLPVLGSQFVGGCSDGGDVFSIAEDKQIQINFSDRLAHVFPRVGTSFHKSIEVFLYIVAWFQQASQ